MSSIVVTPKTSRCTGAVLSRWTMLDHSLPILAELNLAEIRYSTQITHIFLKKGKKKQGVLSSTLLGLPVQPYFVWRTGHIRF